MPIGAKCLHRTAHPGRVRRPVRRDVLRQRNDDKNDQNLMKTMGPDFPKCGPMDNWPGGRILGAGNADEY